MEVGGCGSGVAGWAVRGSHEADRAEGVRMWGGGFHIAMVGLENRRILEKQVGKTTGRKMKQHKWDTWTGALV